MEKTIENEMRKLLDPDSQILARIKSLHSALVSGEIIPTRVNRSDLIEMLGYALKNWYVNRKQALMNLAAKEQTCYPGKTFFQKLYSYNYEQKNDYDGLGDDTDNVWGAVSSLFNNASKLDWGLILGKKPATPATPATPAVEPTIKYIPKTNSPFSMSSIMGSGGLNTIILEGLGAFFIGSLIGNIFFNHKK